MFRCLMMVFLFICQSSLAQASYESFFDQKLSSDQLEKDLDILQAGLTKIHPSLYRYSSKSHLDSLFSHSRKELEQDNNIESFYGNVCHLIAEIKCQHTVATPKHSILNEIQNEGKFLPLSTFWEFDPVTVFVSYDTSDERDLPPGSEIISIDGQSMEQIYTYLTSFFPSDGDIISNKNSRLMYGLEFHLWYYLLMSRPDSFMIKFKTPEGHVIERRLAALTVKQLTKNYKKYSTQKNVSYAAYLAYWKAWNKKNNSKPIRLELLSGTTALLTVSNFLDHNFETVIDKAFQEIKSKKIQDLIIDVRGNEGGSDIYGRHLFKYLIEEPTKYFDSLYTSHGIIDTTFLFKHTDKDKVWYDSNLALVSQLTDGRYATKPNVNKGLLIQEPASNHFEGSTYIIMDGRSASTASEFTAAMHFNRLAIFVGEESGGAYHGGNGGDFATLTLPNSMIEVQIPLSRYVMNSDETRFKRQGTLPDFFVDRTMDDVLKGRDPQLEFVLKLIKDK